MESRQLDEFNPQIQFTHEGKPNDFDIHYSVFSCQLKENSVSPSAPSCDGPISLAEPPSQVAFRVDDDMTLEPLPYLAELLNQVTLKVDDIMELETQAGAVNVLPDVNDNTACDNYSTEEDIFDQSAVLETDGAVNNLPDDNDGTSCYGDSSEDDMSDDGMPAENEDFKASFFFMHRTIVTLCVSKNHDSETRTY